MKRTVYTDNNLREISFPIGGIGTGCIGLAGNGALVDWEIFNRPNKGGDNGFSHFAIKAERTDGSSDTRVLVADTDKDLSGTYNHGYGSGLRSCSMQGFPHFRCCRFTGEFPVATVEFIDGTFPGEVSLTGWNPLIPLDANNSGIPAAFFEIEVTNTTDSPVVYHITGSLRNPSDSSVNETKVSAKGRFLLLRQTAYPSDSPDFKELALATDSPDAGCQTYWYRGGWNDGLERYWRNLTEEKELSDRTYTVPGHYDTGTISSGISLSPGETGTVRFVISWYVPNCRNYWNPYIETTADGAKRDVTWKNYYATLWNGAHEVASYALDNWDDLKSKTEAYRSSVFSSTLPEAAKEAAASCVAVLKSPTVMRLPDGTFYGWEGVNETTGSCEGTCTHVWNYAYALCFLFPELERTIREADFRYNQDEHGRMAFRMQLPPGRGRSGFRACVDGQMGGVIKTYREWKLSGDDEWLKTLWDKVKKSLEYAWSEHNPDRWDRDCDGVLEGRQHHTLDMELFGASSWLEGFYLAALRCAAEMADRLGDRESAEKYLCLFNKGKEYLDSELWNGRWYYQKIDLTDDFVLSPYPDAEGSYWNSESGEIKYQIGEGCEIDQCLAQWHADVCGIGGIFDKTKLRTALESLYRNNFLPDMRSHYNTFRLFAVNDEAGAIICSFPSGIKAPAIPIPYAQESMHGFEYALAGLMIAEGMREQGLKIITSVRDRYRGNNRNPWNEIECGSNYARSMAAFALFPIYAGFSFNMPEGGIGFDPVSDGDFKAPWFTGNTWGVFERTSQKTTLTVLGSPLRIRSIYLPYLNKVTEILTDGKKADHVFKDGKLSFDAVIERELTVSI